MGIKQVQTNDQNLQFIQDNFNAAVVPIQNSPLVYGRTIESVAIATTGTAVPHNLGHQPSKWVITDQNTNTSVYRTAWDSRTITLKCGSSCTISLWVS